MIKARFAKSAIENEEGLNHLWIQIGPLEAVEHAEVGLQLPAGVYFGRACGGSLNKNSEGFTLLEPARVNELLVEIYTRQPIDCGWESLGVTVTYTNQHRCELSEVLTVSLSIVEAESAEAEEIHIDEEVVRKVKEAVWPPGEGVPPSGNPGFLDCTPAKQITYDPNYRSELEKQYRVEGGNY
ncbi:hypothetical protein [Paenibacillus ihuae]|uniref:hypothetical protein n=1 Tax=Paenibacillus ihuae TaxID=1232431 RepID=UPI0006D55373|nr:hypothetical protein [Paenibacillus ihuae]